MTKPHSNYSLWRTSSIGLRNFPIPSDIPITWDTVCDNVELTVRNQMELVCKLISAEGAVEVIHNARRDAIAELHKFNESVRQGNEWRYEVEIDARDYLCFLDQLLEHLGEEKQNTAWEQQVFKEFCHLCFEFKPPHNDK